MVRIEKISSEWQLCGRKCLVDVRGQRRMGRLVRDDRKATVTQITLVTTKICRIPSLNAQHVEPWSRCTAAEDHTGCRSCQLRTGNGGDCQKNVAWSEESRFLLRLSDGRVRIWRKEHESMDPSCLVSTVQGGGGSVMVGEYLLAYFGPLSTNWASLKRHSLPEYCCWPCPMTMTLWLQCTHLLMTTSSRIMHHVTKLKSSQTGFWTWQWVHFTQMASTVTRSQSNRDLWDVVERKILIWMCSRQICSNCVMLSCQYGPKSLRNVSNTLLNLCYE